MENRRFKLLTRNFLTIYWYQEVVVGPENRTVASNDNFLRVNLIGDFVGYTNIPSFEDFYLVIPRQVCLYSLYGCHCNPPTLCHESNAGRIFFSYSIVFFHLAEMLILIWHELCHGTLFNKIVFCR